MEGFADWLEWERTNTYVHLPVKSRSPSSLTIFTRDRQEHALRPVVKQLVRHIYSFGLYDDVIESTYLNLTHAYYTKESNDLVANGVTAANFLNKHDERVQQESVRAADVLLDRSFASVKDTAQGALVTGRLQWLAKDGKRSVISRYTFPNDLYSSQGVFRDKARHEAPEHVQHVLKGWRPEGP